MSWTSLKSRLKELPLILAGPILRRVTPESATVWLALKDAKTVRLVVKEWNQEKQEEFSSEETTPVTLGTNLHVICVTARSPSDNQNLTPGILYTYDLIFKNGERSERLNDIVHPNLLSYDDIGFPSFVLPPADRKKLRLCQGSCRKPHGPGRDALAILDELIKRDAKNPEKRPQLLALTGDQIYADDVADALLFMIMDGAWTLLDEWDEVIAGSIGALSSHPPGKRAEIVRRKDVNFTSGVTSDLSIPKSHLMGFSEYLLMYLFVWSDVLWDDQLPDFITVTGDHERISCNSFNGSALVTSVQDHPKLSRFKQENEKLDGFKKDLVLVRRAMANIPTYMIFDDHEVTDDWYINAKWCIEVLKSQAGRHIITNALTAYVLCQAWGNTPDLFLPQQTGFGFLSILNSRAYRKIENRFELGEYLLPPIDKILDDKGHLNQPEKTIVWHYSIIFNSFELIAVNTRTQRWYPSDDRTAPPVLLSEKALCNQIQSFTQSLVILIFPPPLIGMYVTEVIQASETTWGGRMEYDCESPNLQPYFVERFLSRLASVAPPMIGANIIIFTGDVHYGFAVSLEYNSDNPFMERGNLPTPIQIFVYNLTASAFKNEPDGWIKRRALRYAHTKLWQELGKLKAEAASGTEEWTREDFVGFGNIASIRDKLDKALDSAMKGLYQLTSKFPPLLEEILKKIIPINTDYFNRSHRVQELKFLSEAARVDISFITGSTDIKELKSDWDYKIKWIQDKRNDNEREGSTDENRLLVGPNNLGILFVDESNNMFFELWWYVDETNIPMSAATLYKLGGAK